MTITLELTPDETARLQAQAERENQAIEEYLHTLIAQFPPTPSAPTGEKSPLRALLERWDAEDETDDEEELLQRDMEWEELRGNLAANRLSLRAWKP